MLSRRNFLAGSAIALAGAGLVSRSQAAAIPEASTMASPAMQPPLAPRRAKPISRW